MPPADSITAAPPGSSVAEVYANGALSKGWQDYSYNGHTDLRSSDWPFGTDSFSAEGNYTNFGAMAFFSGHGVDAAAENSTLMLSFAIRVSNASGNEVQVALYGSRDVTHPFSAAFVSHFTPSCSLPVNAWQLVEIPVASLLPPLDPGGGVDNCSDIAPPPGQYSCAQQKGWGKCEASFMKGFCCKTCFECQSGCGKLQAAGTLPTADRLARLQHIKITKVEFKANYKTGAGAFSLDQVQFVKGGA